MPPAAFRCVRMPSRGRIHRLMYLIRTGRCFGRVCNSIESVTASLAGSDGEWQGCLGIGRFGLLTGLWRLGRPGMHGIRIVSIGHPRGGGREISKGEDEGGGGGAGTRRAGGRRTTTTQSQRHRCVCGS